MAARLKEMLIFFILVKWGSSNARGHNNISIPSYYNIPSDYKRPGYDSRKRISNNNRNEDFIPMSDGYNVINDDPMPVLRRARIKKNRVKCGKDFNSDSGSIQYPVTGDRYPDKADCSWRINVSPGDRIEMSFTRFHTESCCDFVYIRDGGSRSSPLLGEYKGETLPPSVNTTTNKAFIRFTSDLSNTEPGFALTWNTVECGNDFNSESGSIQYPVTGGRYPDKARCTWRVIVSPGAKIELTFTRFNTELCCDFVYIRDGGSSSSRQLGKYSGSTLTNNDHKYTLPFSLRTTTNKAFISFTSDHSKNGTGFTLTWNIVESAGVGPVGCNDKRTYCASLKHKCKKKKWVKKNCQRTCGLCTKATCNIVRCGNNEQCTDHGGTIPGVCSCKSGYVKHQQSCKATCNIVRCGSNEQCNDHGGTIPGVCSCKSGYVKHQQSCKATCNIVRCGNNEQCTDHGGTKPGVCSCKSGYVKHQQSCKESGKKSGKDCPNCGIANLKGKVYNNVYGQRIAGGEEIKPPHKYPWLVLLHSHFGELEGFCGGSIINSQYVLTASHCLDTGIDYGCNVADRTKVHVGLHKFDHSDEIKGVTRIVGVDKYIRHPRYICKGYQDNDIALLKLDVTLDFFNDEQLKGIGPVCLPVDDSESYDGYRGIAAGWGATFSRRIMIDDNPKSYKSPQPVPSEVTIPIRDYFCKAYPSHFMTDNMMCAGQKEEGKDSCEGDSGGPLVVLDEGKYVLVGVVSFGPESGDCNGPGVYARVSKYLDWIDMNTQDIGCNMMNDNRH